MSNQTNDDQGLSALKRMRTEMQTKTTSATSTKKTSKLSAFIPQYLKDQVGGVSRKQWIDVTLFVGCVAVMYRFGSTVSDQIDSYMPNEEQMQKMMQDMQMQAQQGGMGGQMM